MKEKISRLIRTTFGFLLVGVLLFGMVLVYIWFFFAHYNALVQSFELRGFDQKPLSESRLLGWMFEAFGLGNASQCELYALVVTLGMGISVMILCFHINQLITLLRDRAVFIARGDCDSAKNVLLKIRHEILPWLIIWFTLTIFTTWWDLTLFIFRSLAGAMGIDDPEAAFSIKKLDILLKEYGDYLSIDDIDFSRYGYAASIFGISFGLEFIFTKFSDRFELLLDAIADFSSESSNPQQEVLQSQAVSAIEDMPAGQNQNPEDVNEDAIDDGQETADVTIQPPQRVEMDEEIEVIGGNGTHIRRAEALAHKDIYYLDNEGRVWDKNYYNSLHGMDPVEERKGAA